ncbi:MAG TPA: arsenic resistance N-acetyltransferase ArsN2, partial [Bacteroidota bacterium]|nr:arsenic resistance N-acetyltransferase ArsN2 [Bacteroidota bacterium]
SAFLVAEVDKKIVGAAGLELYNDIALLRSVVVEKSLRNSGIGSTLYDAIVQLAGTKNIRCLILLTTTADKYFERKGFVRIERSTLTGPITQSVEFTPACPSSAICMAKEI